MNKTRRALPLDLICLCAIFAWLAVYSFPIFSHSLAGNYREIQTYNLDSMVMLRAVEDALHAPWFRFSFNDYGHLYFNLCMAVAKLYALTAPLTERALFLILKAVALAGSCCAIATSYFFAKRYLGRGPALFAAIVLAFSPRYIEYSTEVKPDSWQVFLLVLSLYFLGRAFEASPTSAGRGYRALRSGLGFTLAASAAAGAAFGTKYQGIFLIPFLAMAAWCVPATVISDRALAIILRWFAVVAIVLGGAFWWVGREAYPLNLLHFLLLDAMAGVKSGPLYWSIQATRIGSYLGALACFAFAAAYASGVAFTPCKIPLKKLVVFAATALAFVVAFVMTSPWSLWHLQFLSAILQRSDSAGAGAWFGLGWLKLIFGWGDGYPQNYLAHATALFSFIGAGRLLVLLTKRDVRAAILPFYFVLGFALIFFALLIVKINFITTLYPLPLVPPLALLAAFGLQQTCTLLPRWLDQRRAASAAAVLTLALSGWQIWQGGGLLLQYRMLVTDLSSENKQLGGWLARCVPADAKLLAAAYSYAPPKIADVLVNMGPDVANLARQNPALVTINWDDVATTARQDKRAATLSGPGRYYAIILHSPDWQAGPRFGPWQVFAKIPNSKIDPACR